MLNLYSLYKYLVPVLDYYYSTPTCHELLPTLSVMDNNWELTQVTP
jgi:hypothetical protein